MNNQNLESTARALVAPGKGILAADESFPTIEKRFKKLGIPSTEENRRAYRELLFTAPSLGHYISGVILFDETIRQKTAAGQRFVDLLAGEGVIPGIKVDAGAKDFARFPGEKITEGLDGLQARLEEYAGLGARFAKWRAVITIGAGLPTAACLEANAHALARYAGLCQETGLVPIVEPEVLMDGAHGIDRCFDVTVAVLQAVFAQLHHYRIVLEQMLLKPNMVLPGEEAETQSSVTQVAEKTSQCLARTVPPAVPGIVFLSGGQSDRTATAHLQALNHGSRGPWTLSFSYGRALQDAAMEAWRGRAENVSSAQSALILRARCNSAAAKGDYSPEMESETPPSQPPPPPRSKEPRRRAAQK